MAGGAGENQGEQAEILVSYLEAWGLSESMNYDEYLHSKQNQKTDKPRLFELMEGTP